MFITITTNKRIRLNKETPNKFREWGKESLIGNSWHT